MAVVQISKVQVRRGLQQDLPQLSGGEFGWSLDEQRLFIGNGAIGEGAPEEGVTELLTLRRLTEELPNAVFYTFMGQEGGYTAQTGPDRNHPVVRTFQRKLDAWVSVRDFGAIGDGVIDDTDAINRAILEIYQQERLLSSRLVRRILKFEGGTYKVTGKIKVPPWLTILGDGIDNTVIKQSNAGINCVFETANSSYIIGAGIGLGSIILPKYINVSNLTIENENDVSLFVINSASSVHFHRVGFKGPLSNPTSDTGSTCISLVSTAAPVKNITFSDCEFSGLSKALNCDSLANDIRFSNCTFDSLYRGIVLGEATGPGSCPSNVRVFNSYFKGIANRAIDVYNGCSGVTSIGNHYANCGNDFTESPVSTIIHFDYEGNYSIGDTFDRTSSQNDDYARVWFEDTKNVYVSNATGVVAGTMTIGVGKLITLVDDISSFISTGIELTSPCVLNYSITRNGKFRTGSLHFTNDGNGPEFQEIYTESKSGVGVTLSVNNSNIVTYKTTNASYDAVLKYNITHF